MNKNLKSPTKLTEFAPLQAEEKQAKVGQFFSKFFKRATATVETVSNPETNADNVSQEALPSWAIDKEAEPHQETVVYNVDVTDGRSLPNVLKRIINLLAMKSNNLQAYSDSDLKQYWMPDSVSKECYECCEKFTTFRRRHHCRVCGQIFCSSCCNQQIPGKIFGCTGDLRVCTYCCKVVLSYLKSSDISSDLNSDLKVLQESLRGRCSSTSLNQNLLSPNANSVKSIEAGGTLKRKISVGYQEEKFAAGRSSVSYLSSEEKLRALQNSTSLRNLYEEISKPNSGIEFTSRRYRLRNYNDCLMGSELVDWLIRQQKANSRIQASALCQALLDGGYMVCISEPCTFIDGMSLYKLGVVSSPEVIQSEQTFEATNQDEPSWVQYVPHETSTNDSENEQLSPKNLQLTSSSSYTLDLNVGANTVYLSRPPISSGSIDESDADLQKCQIACNDTTMVRTSEQREFVPESGWHNVTLLREENGEKAAYEVLSNAFSQHESSLCKQLLSVNGLSLTWSEYILPLVREIVDVIRPDVNHDAEELDIRQYVKFKVVSGGHRSNCELVRGIVCSKNVVHKAMSVKLENPKILLLEGSIVYQRTEGRLMSLEPVLMQEHEYLRHVAARINALQPNIVIVQKNVSRLAQDLLREQGVTLVINVKQKILERISRCTQADIISPVDVHIGRPRLGTCKKFYLRTFEVERGRSKTLMYFEGLPNAHLGATVLLRGGFKSELVHLKNVMSFLLFACYNWRLEKSLLMDAFAVPPNNKYEFFDESKENSPITEVAKFETKVKKIDEKAKPEIVKESINDFSDPLHSCKVEDFKENCEKLSVAELPLSNHFRKALDDTILCISPYLVFSMPYLETENGRKCRLRNFFPEQIYYSDQFSNQKKKRSLKEDNIDLVNNIDHLKSPHEFVTTSICTNVDSNDIQAVLANFRAVGGRLPKKQVLDIVCTEDDRVEKKEKFLDPRNVFDPRNHQRLAVLFCSFSQNSSNAPAFCVNPWVVTMDFYGRNDIPLGCFLERYCYRPTYTCQSKCDTPMMQHTRRFVHYNGCVSISLYHVEKSMEEKIIMWSWCSKCQIVSPMVPMSSDTWSCSFAKYLELRFHGGIYTRRSNTLCQHSLHHDYHQYFSYKDVAVCFKYTTVQLWEIYLPSFTIEMHYSSSKQQCELIEEMKVLASKGHDIFSLVSEQLALLPHEVDIVKTYKQNLAKDQSIFKQRIEEIQLKLTSPTIENKENDFKDPNLELQRAFWRISDALVRIKRMIVETVDVWKTKLSDAAIKKEEKKKDRNSHQELESPSSETRYLLSETSDSEGNKDEPTNVGIITKKNRSLDQGDEDPKASPKCHQRSQSDGTVLSQLEDVCDGKKEVDRKSVKNIFSIFSSTPFTIPPPFNNNEHYTLASGVYAPIVVYENEPSSIVAYALNSFEYKKVFEELSGKKPQSAEQTPSPVHKRKNQSDRSERGESGEFGASNEKTSGLLSFLRNKESKSDISNSATANVSEMSQSFEAPPVEKVEDHKKSKTEHIEIQFEDVNCNFFCRIFCAEKFATLRKSVLPIGEEAYIRSLSRSVQWNARGGKSGSTFCKTMDDRFILKEMPKSEVQLFLESAPSYFAYLHRCLSAAQPTLLGKIIGIYQIIYRNVTTNATLRTHLLVMENLFYNRVVTQKFDLKGSMRNRLVNPDNQDGEIVLLDENLLKMTCDNPLYVLPHSKAVLIAAIQNDTEYLSTQSVMDYSLLVGLDSENKELVLGIIDYIRTFTWDKKLETIVKKTGLLGGQGKLPTIISPQEYQKRFEDAMHRYFLEVPDPWAGLGKGLEY
ncbi:PREDICTED: 1-phosphatidylinositol 3-phosphate 5-kinase [Nicrophorus vespilloides]|uniref:1-phosphatidylinositol-3-phosphate 5-kinase n=1 Tax=Nicrophorus vespilloides TaxID=110193 RepID=A0ABM1MQ45_NICVS|nr:PREDICTED: 1-phosphatidylinositol 3-phosphate 5-kinase [Nicrophorus vespilloides]